MAENTNNSVLAVREESVEGTLIAPSGGTQYVPLRPGFDLEPNFEAIETDEIRSSIGSSKVITGLETPNFRWSGYLKHSGTEGTAPNWGIMIESCIGSVTSNSTQRSTTTSSTSSVLKLGAGGSEFARGFAVLVKHSSAAWEILPVFSVSSNDLTLGFNLTTTPGSGIGVGKCVNYSPLNSGHPSYSAWLFRGNGGAVEAIAGLKTTELQISAQAGQPVEVNITAQGSKFFYNPITIASADRYLDFTDDDGTFAAVVTAKTYRDPHELAQALQDAMNAANSGETHTVVYSDTTGKFTISCTGTVLSLLWNTGTNTANTIGDKIGFVVSSDDSGTAATTGYTSDNAQDFARLHTPSYDSADPLIAKNNVVLIGDSTYTTCVCLSSIDARVTNDAANLNCICAESGISGNVFTKRRVTISIVGEMKRYDVDKFRRFRENDDTRFLWAFGERVGGNWVAGKSGCLFLPTCTISSFKNGDEDGSVTFEAELTAYVDSSGNGEVYLNFL